MRIYTATDEKTGEKRDITIRALTRREIKDLKPIGYGYFGCVPDREKGDEIVDKGLACVLSDEDQAFLDGCPGRDLRNSWQEMIKETYGDRVEEKNSGNTSDGSQTENA